MIKANNCAGEATNIHHYPVDQWEANNCAGEPTNIHHYPVYQWEFEKEL